MNDRQQSAIADAVLHHMLLKYGLRNPDEILPLLEDSHAQVFDLGKSSDLAQAAEAVRGPVARFKFRVDLDRIPSNGVHPMVNALREADEVLRLGREIEHPLEEDNRDEARQYSGVVTIRSVPSAGLALSEHQLPFHQDGLGTAGSVRYIAMCLDHGPKAGGGQVYVNLIAQGLLLAAKHWRRFVDATRTDALSVVRSAGSQMVSVTGPIFYVDETGLVASHFRADGGEYQSVPSPDVATWFDEFVEGLQHSGRPESLGRGDCLVVDNLSMAHARLAYVGKPSSPRRLARKWYAIDPSRDDIWGQPTLRLDPSIYR